MRDVMAIPVFTGLKTQRGKFAGAVRSWTCEGVMRDGKALQMGTSHELGQNFSKAFGTLFTDREGRRQHPWQTSWGASTRLLGALIMVHGDDQGLRLPPRLAPVQAVVLVAKDEGGAGDEARQLAGALGARGVRVEVDDAVDVSFGRRVVDWELKGVPLRVELGPRDVAAGQAVVASRARGSKATVPLEQVTTHVAEAVEADQAALLEQATSLREDRTAAAVSIDDAAELAQAGFARIPWA